MIVRAAIRDAPGMTCPWPPTSKDLTLETARSVIPSELFNLIAWCCGLSEEPCFTDNTYVNDEDHTKLLSVCQDIVYMASNGRKQTPKSLCLGMTVRHLTGSSQMIKLLNNLGHCSSWDTTIGLDTSLAQLQLATAHIVPQGFAEKVPTILVWDNIDYKEETPSGHGTTHHTNGLMIQSEISEHVPLQNRPVMKKGVRSLIPTITELNTFTSATRKGPKYVCNATLLMASLYEAELTPALKKDFAF